MVTSQLGVGESRERSHRSAKAGPAIYPVPKSLAEKHTDRKTALITVPTGLWLRASQAASCKCAGALLWQSQRLWGAHWVLGEGDIYLNCTHKLITVKISEQCLLCSLDVGIYVYKSVVSNLPHNEGKVKGVPELHFCKELL